MNRGLEVAIAMWAMTALSLALVALRLYTRVRIVKFVGIEDHLFVWTGIFLLTFTVSIQVAVHYGLGRSFWTLSLDNSSNAILWTYIANTFAITGNAMAKLSMGFFLLRVVQLRGQKFALWLLIIVTSGTSIALVVMLWNQTTPVKASWDPLRTPGKWNIQIQPMSVGLGGWSSACDFFFAIFPWMFIWSLRMPRREKIMLASGMSLGVMWVASSTVLGTGADTKEQSWRMRCDSDGCTFAVADQRLYIKLRNILCLGGRRDRCLHGVPWSADTTPSLSQTARHDDRIQRSSQHPRHRPRTPALHDVRAEARRLETTSREAGDEGETTKESARKAGRGGTGTRNAVQFEPRT
jgi:hypothetical protein